MNGGRTAIRPFKRRRRRRTYPKKTALIAKRPIGIPKEERNVVHERNSVKFDVAEKVLRNEVGRHLRRKLTAGDNIARERLDFLDSARHCFVGCRDRVMRHFTAMHASKGPRRLIGKEGTTRIAIGKQVSRRKTVKSSC